MQRILRARAAVFAAAAGAVALSLAACTADVVPSAPRAPDVSAIESPPPPPSDLFGLDIGGAVTGLLSPSLFKCSTPSFGSVTQSVGPAGGVIRIGPHSLVIPAGALDRPVAITASTAAGEHVKVDFLPAGLRFAWPATLGLSYAHCDRHPLLPKVVYVDDLLSILELLPALNDLGAERVTARLRHFSGYAIAD